MAASGSFLPVRRHRRDLVFLLLVAVSVALLGDGPTMVKPAYPSSNNLPLPDLAEPDHSLSLASCRGVRMDPMSANLACSFPSNKIPCFRSVLALPVLLPSKSPWPAFFLCFRTDACSSRCCLVRAGQLRIGACFLGMFWHRFFRFGDIFIYISMHQTETVLRWNHLLSLLPFPEASCWLLAHVLHPISWRRHIHRLHPRRGGSCIAREPRGAVRARRRPLAVSPSCWWQLERRPVAWPAPVSSGDVEAVPKLEETPVLKTDAWTVHRRWVVYVSLLDNIVIFISTRIAYVVWDFYVLFLYYDLF